MNEHLLKIKEEQKDLALRIRSGKTARKPKFRCDDNIYDLEDLSWNRYVFRHQHIAYCTIRGRSRQDIECPRKDNLPDENYISSIIKEYNEAVCAGEKRLTA